MVFVPLNVDAMLKMIAAGALGLALTAAACTADPGREGEPRIVASFYPLHFVTERVAGEDTTVRDLTPPGAEPHDLELSPSQAAELGQADLLVYAGGGFQPAVEDLLGEVPGRAFDALEVIELLDEGGEEDGHDDDPGEADDEGEPHEDDAHDHRLDPHFWLDPLRLAAVADAVAEELDRVLPERAEEHRRNAEALVVELEALDGEFEEALAECDSRLLVVSHEAFGYLADRYDLEQEGVAGIDPESEPSPRRMAEVANLARDRGVNTIYFERLVSPAVARALAREVGADTAVMDPLESPPEEGDYISAMRENLAALQSGLGCR